MQGVVVKNAGSWYVVCGSDGKPVRCQVKGTFRLRGIRTTNPVAVGDCVEVVCGEGDTGLISEVIDRRNYVVRKASNLSKQSHILAANIDQSLLLITVKKPETSTTFIDRYLAVSEAYRIPVSLFFNKMDSYGQTEQAQVEGLSLLYTSLGYPCLAASALTGEGLDTVRAALRGKTTLLSGNSGVGKSTLLNALLPEADARTADISQAHQTGMHTTTFSQMFMLPEGGALIDIPGIKGMGTYDMKREEVSHYFKEIFRIAADCRYANCTHTHEPDCAVRAAVEAADIAPSRYTSYLSMLSDGTESKYRQGYKL